MTSRSPAWRERSSLYGLVWGAAIVNHSAIKQCVLDHVSA
jgi:hypothetical protein